MKKNIKLAALLTLFVVLFAGCEKKNEWRYFYNYSIDDIVGTYHYSNVSNAFEFLTESDALSICEDAELTIVKESETMVRVHLKCPDEGYNQTFVGNPINARDDFRIYLNKEELGREYEFDAIVYTNDKGDIRLHGYGRKGKSDPNIGHYWENWYFDMIKD